MPTKNYVIVTFEGSHSLRWIGKGSRECRNSNVSLWRIEFHSSWKMKTEMRRWMIQVI